MPNQQTEKCALPRCTCPVSAGEIYCSEECRAVHANPDEQAGECPCGHAQCSSEGQSDGVTL